MDEQPMLPPEIILQVLRHLSCISTADKVAYAASRATLVVCSLLSRAWRPVVLSELCRNVRIKELAVDRGLLPWFISRVLDDNDSDVDRRFLVRELSIDLDQGHQKKHTKHQVPRELGRMPRLQAIELCGFHIEWASLFQSYPSLKRVALSGCLVNTTLSLSTVVHAEELALDNCTILTRDDTKWSLDPRVFPKLNSLTIKGPLHMSGDMFLGAFERIIDRVERLALSFEPRWEPTGPSAAQLNLWITHLLARCSSLSSISLDIVTINPWIALALRAATLRPRYSQDIRHLEIVLQPDKEHQPIRDMSLCFSRLMMIELRSGALPKLETFRVVDRDGKDLKDVMVTRGLVEQLQQTGVALSSANVWR
ncbi:hypothetical protein OIV83_005506 [Microbotryomycetes sp. JL201]|nr:hypothetical protein OIV83_005506 [Microbotryomycetes sp. JL201]